MRGGITYSEILESSFMERELISKIVKHNLEITKESKMPFY